MFLLFTNVGHALPLFLILHKDKPAAFRSNFVLDKEVGCPFQARVRAAKIVRTTIDLRGKGSGCREGSESNEAEHDKGTSMVGVIRQCNRIVGLG